MGAAPRAEAQPYTPKVFSELGTASGFSSVHGAIM
jgi:hypothetical protein